MRTKKNPFGPLKITKPSKPDFFDKLILKDHLSTLSWCLNEYTGMVWNLNRILLLSATLLPTSIGKYILTNPTFLYAIPYIATGIYGLTYAANFLNVFLKERQSDEKNIFNKYGRSIALCGMGILALAGLAVLAVFLPASLPYLFFSMTVISCATSIYSKIKEQFKINKAIETASHSYQDMKTELQRLEQKMKDAPKTLHPFELRKMHTLQDEIAKRDYLKKIKRSSRGMAISNITGTSLEAVGSIIIFVTMFAALSVSIPIAIPIIGASLLAIGCIINGTIALMGRNNRLKTKNAYFTHKAKMNLNLAIQNVSPKMLKPVANSKKISSNKSALDNFQDSRTQSMEAFEINSTETSSLDNSDIHYDNASSTLSDSVYSDLSSCKEADQDHEDMDLHADFVKTLGVS